MPSSRDKYDLAGARLKAFTRSANRSKLMLCLLEKAQDAAELEKKMRIRPTTIHHSIKELIDENLVAKKDWEYELTNIGRVQALILAGLVNTVAAIDHHRDFWLNHDISGIPPELQKNIGMLAHAEVITSDSSAPLRTHEYFLAELCKAREIHGVSPVIYPGYSEAIARGVEMDTQIDLILTDKILDIVAKDYTDLVRGLLQHDNFRLYSTAAEVREAFTVTDTVLSLGLFRLNGDYDIGNDLVCKGDKARKWGMDLFDYYLSISTQIDDI